MTILNKYLRLRNQKRGTTHRIGDKRHGAPGGYRQSAAFVASYTVADRLAAEAGLDREHGHRFLIALGKVMQRMLLEGDVVGIPFLGCIAVQEHRTRISSTGIGRGCLPGRAISPGLVGKDGLLVTRRPRLFMAAELRVVFNDSAVYRGLWRDLLPAKRDELKRRLRTVYGGTKTERILQHTKEGSVIQSGESGAPSAITHEARHSGPADGAA